MENIAENKYSIIFKEVDGVVDYSTINRVVEAQEGEVVKSFATVQELNEFLSVVTNDEAKKFQIREVDGELSIYRVAKTEAELSKEQAIKRNAEIIKELRDERFTDAQLKCISDGLVFADKYPELAAERLELLAEFNANEALI